MQTGQEKNPRGCCLYYNFFYDAAKERLKNSPNVSPQCNLVFSTLDNATAREGSSSVLKLLCGGLVISSSIYHVFHLLYK